MVDNKLGAYLVMFITVIVGIALLGSMADSIWENRNAYAVTAEVLDVTSARTNYNPVHNDTSEFNPLTSLSLANDNIRSVSAVTLSNGTALTQGTDWRFVDRLEGTVNILNSTITTRWNFTTTDGVFNQTNWTYLHSDTYVEDATSRTFLGFIVLFFVIGIVLFVIAVINKDFLSELLGKR